VVSIQVYTVRQGQLAGRGAGSGFLLDEQGHVITNNHVVANADIVTVFYHDGFETEAQIIGTDQDSDLAVIKVDTLHEGTHPLPLGDSEAVQVGEPVAAIGNPFGQQSSISAGIVSATGRTIPTGVTPFAIPQAIQTDAAINPGNSGGPLLNLEGEVIGVNAQIATSGTGVSAGVGFAIPSNVVRRVIPVLIEKGEYAWPWLGVRGGPVSLALQQAMNLPDQQGAYLHEIISGGPADRAGLQGSSETAQFHGMDFPAGGDIVRGINGTPIEDFNDLLVEVAFRQPGEEVELTVLRGDETLRVDVTLAPRPASFQSEGSP
jgi:S1-C subfamily serine protease